MYLVAMRTLAIGEVLSPTDPRVPQLRALLEEMSPKCKEDRFELAAALIAAHDALVMHGVDESAVAILVQANATLSDQPRRSWPMSCTEVINRIVAAKTPAG